MAPTVSPMRAALVAALTMFAVVSVSVLTAAQPSAPMPARSVWSGVYTSRQAARGKDYYAEHCAECHGGTLQGGEGKGLRGEAFWTAWKEDTLDQLLTFVSKNMPRSEDGSTAGTLSPTTYADIVAHILSSNDFPSGNDDLTLASSAGVAIIRKEGPGELPTTTLAHLVGCLAPRGADGSWRVEKGTRPVRVAAGAKDTTKPEDATIALGERTYQLKFVLTPLVKYVGHRVAVTGLLLGEGGVDGLNVNTVTSVADTCS